MQACPAGLFLRQGQASRVPHDLAHARVAKEVGVHRCRLADAPVPRSAQGQHVDIGSLGRRFDDLPGAHTVDRLTLAMSTALAREEERLVVIQGVLACPEEQLTWQAGVGGGGMCRLNEGLGS